MEYSKRPIDIPEQISILTNRGLLIDSESFAQLSTILYLEQSIVSNSAIKERLLALLASQPYSNLKAMGFPENWREQELWA